jgi:hypothetical protein
MCAAYGYVLGKPKASTQQNKAIEKERARTCDRYGQPKPHTPVRVNTEVFLGVPELRVGASDPIAANISSCGACSKFIPEMAVAVETGWSAGVCAAKGRLILGPRQSGEAENCSYREFGAARNVDDLRRLTYLPLFSDSLASIPLSPIAAYFKAKEDGTNIIEPSTYVSDAPLSAEDKDACIRAWRRIEDPDGSGNAVYFPIFDPDELLAKEKITEAQRAMVPVTGSDEHPELYVDHFGGLYGLGVAWFGLDETPALWGQPGVGKTELLQYAAWIMQLPFVRISFTASSQVDEIIGSTKFDPERGTYFVYGDLPNGWTIPCVLCLDEPNTSPPEVWQRVRPLTDNSKQLVIAENSSERLPRNEYCHMGMCMNPAWDIRNIGALELADADTNRLFHTYIDLPPEELEIEIIKERVKLDDWELNETQVKAIMATAKNIREQAEADNLPLTWAIRQQIKVARALRWYSPTTAYSRAAGDFLEPPAREILLDQVRANFPTED